MGGLKNNHLAEAGTSAKHVGLQVRFPHLDSRVASLVFVGNLPVSDSYEIHGVRRGIGVTFAGLDIVAEGMGIGGPLGLYKRRAVFALDAYDKITRSGLLRTFSLNGLSMKKIGHLRVDAPYRMIHRALTPLYVRDRLFRPFYKFLMSVRTAVGLKSEYSRAEERGRAYVSYEFVDDSVHVIVELEGLEGGQLLVANELSGKLFASLFLDDKEVGEIPPWTRVSSEKVVLASSTLRLAMEVHQVEGCTLYAGREVLGNRLNWSGFSYVLKPGLRKISYRVRFFVIG